MDIKDGKITKATQRELYRIWRDTYYLEDMTFSEYLYSMKKAGTEIIYDNTSTEVDRKELLLALEEYWEKVPHMRFGQIIENISQLVGKDPFFIEDYDIVKEIERQIGK